jgi:hypothetical protein
MRYFVGRVLPNGRYGQALELNREAAYAYARTCFQLGCSFFFRRVP